MLVCLEVFRRRCANNVTRRVLLAHASETRAERQNATIVNKSQAKFLAKSNKLTLFNIASKGTFF